MPTLVHTYVHYTLPTHHMYTHLLHSGVTSVYISYLAYIWLRYNYTARLELLTALNLYGTSPTRIGSRPTGMSSKRLIMWKGRKSALLQSVSPL